MRPRWLRVNGDPGLPGSYCSHFIDAEVLLISVCCPRDILERMTFALGKGNRVKLSSGWLGLGGGARRVGARGSGAVVDTQKPAGEPPTPAPVASNAAPSEAPAAEP